MKEQKKIFSLHEHKNCPRGKGLGSWVPALRRHSKAFQKHSMPQMEIDHHSYKLKESTCSHRWLLESEPAYQCRSRRKEQGVGQSPSLKHLFFFFTVFLMWVYVSQRTTGKSVLSCGSQGFINSLIRFDAFICWAFSLAGSVTVQSGLVQGLAWVDQVK